MKLMLVRHADAGDADSFARTGQPDHLRPLSPRGHEQMRDAVKGLRTMFAKPDVILSSPYLRATATADVIRREYELPSVVTTPVLEPEALPEDFERWMRDQPRHDAVIVVGHEPNLSVLASWLTAGSHVANIEFKKGGACLLALGRRPKKGEGAMRWLMGPKELAAIGTSGG
ncbi:MAG: histidine phosphatase family protein [Gemmatimonadaceae bacterium]